MNFRAYFFHSTSPEHFQESIAANDTALQEAKPSQRLQRLETIPSQLQLHVPRIL
jgi:hypothetical protein